MSPRRRKHNSPKNTPMSRTGKAVLAVSLIVIFVAAWQIWADSAKAGNSAAQGLAPGDSTNLTTVVMPADMPSQIVPYHGFTLSFNPRMHVPNWVAWELTADETDGTVSRENKFYCDEQVTGCAESYDYNYSGYDRGHMCPAGDMKWSRESMHDSFSMANICPQQSALNTGAWKRLEENCRKWAKKHGSLIVICGPVLTDNITEYLGDTRVAVPKRFYKVLLNPNTSPMMGIGFIMNNGRVEGGMQQAAVSIDEVERVTGLDFFSELPDDIENEVERQCEFYKWSRTK